MKEKPWQAWLSTAHWSTQNTAPTDVFAQILKCAENNILSQGIEMLSKSGGALFGLLAWARICGSICLSPQLDGHRLFPLAEGREFKSESLVKLESMVKKSVRGQNRA